MASRAGSGEPAAGPPPPVAGVPRTRRTLVLAGIRAGLGVARRTLGKAWQDRILGMSAESAFWQLLSMPPLLIALVGALGYVARWLGPDAVGQIRDWALSAASQVVTPEVVNQVVAPVLSQILDQNRTDVIGIGTVVALWSGSSATATFVNTITIAYDQRDLRGAVRSRLVALRLYVFTVLAGAVVLPAVAFGPGALDRLAGGRWHAVLGVLVHLLYWPLLAGVVFCGITTFYHLATPVRLRWRRAFPGAVVALAIFLVLSYGLQLYFAAIATNLRFYSTLAAPILALIYFYALAFAVLLGAEFNAALEERWPRGTRASTGEWLLGQANRVRGRRTRTGRPEQSAGAEPAEPGESARRAAAAGPASTLPLDEGGARRGTDDGRDATAPSGQTGPSDEAVSPDKTVSPEATASSDGSAATGEGAASAGTAPPGERPAGEAWPAGATAYRAPAGGRGRSRARRRARQPVSSARHDRHGERGGQADIDS